MDSKLLYTISSVSSQDEMEHERTMSDATSEDSLDKVLFSENREETETERLVRLGEMTPFGSVVESTGGNAIVKNDQLKHDAVDTTEYGDNTGRTVDGEQDFVETGQSSQTKSLEKDESSMPSEFGSKADAPAADSDEEYIPDEEELKLSFRDDEHVLPEDNVLNAADDVAMTTKKTRSPKAKVVKKTKRAYQTVHDDGDDRMFQVRIRYICVC